MLRRVKLFGVGRGGGGKGGRPYNEPDHPYRLGIKTYLANAKNDAGRVGVLAWCVQGKAGLRVKRRMTVQPHRAASDPHRLVESTSQ